MWHKIKNSFCTVRRPLLCLMALTPIFAAVYYLAYWLRFEGDLKHVALGIFCDTLIWVIAIKIICFAGFRVYQGWSHFVTFHDLLILAQAATCSSIAMVLVDYLVFPAMAISRGIFLLDWGTTIFVVGGMLAISRVAREHGRLPFFTGMRKPTLIVGVNNSGEALLRELQREKKLPYRVVGFVTDDSQRVRTRVGGVPVLGTVPETCRLAQQHGIQEVFITAGELSGQKIRRLMKDAANISVQVRVIPSYEQLLQGSVAVQPRPVSIEDLLHRDEVDLDLKRIHGWIDGKTILVTGAAGSIGSEICRQLLKFNPAVVVLLDHNETGQFFLEHELRNSGSHGDIEVCIADIQDASRLQSVFKKYRPDVVFHAAAYKHVPLMESNSGEAVKNIVLATQMLADLAHQHQVGSFVMISTDKAVNPTSTMGACKRIAELYVQALAAKSPCRFVTVRFGNVLDSQGSVVPIFREQIARGGPVTITHPDMRRYFMTIPEASQLVIQAGAMGRGGEIFVLDMGELVKIVDLASDLIRLSGFRVGDDIEIKVVGLRPGEKLYEELNADGEVHLNTCHPKIFVADSVRRDIFLVKRFIADLAHIVDGPNPAIRAAIEQFLTEYSPQRFEPHRHAKAA
ncbi:MAG: SDR family NAD(P)-dependent oxidoreductase [Burkholderiales bacterium]|nr:SDR family NAD(P)-dependent oxidoreductase [Burkholderiales bacterium]